jgi:hypothetical protein
MAWRSDAMLSPRLGGLDNGSRFNLEFRMFPNPARDLRMVMSHQSLQSNAIRLLAAVALLVSVMVSPTRPAPVSGGPSHPDYLRRNFDIPSKVATHHRPHTPVTSRVVQVKALSAQRKLDWSNPSARPDADLAYPPRSDRPSGDSTVAGTGTGRAIHPLRC